MFLGVMYGCPLESEVKGRRVTFGLMAWTQSTGERSDLRLRPRLTMSRREGNTHAASDRSRGGTAEIERHQVTIVELNMP